MDDENMEGLATEPAGSGRYGDRIAGAPPAPRTGRFRGLEKARPEGDMF